MNRRSAGSRAPTVALLASALCWGAVPLAAQRLPEWNDARALDLIERARVERHSAVVDTAFRAYRTEARGYVYFFFDRADSDERTLVKADQIALEVFWQAPNRTRQRIVGLRDEKVLPTNIRYHLDHLTVVQDDFGDRIRIGDGDEVSAVVHPVASEGADLYDYRLADSLSIRYGGGAEEVRVYEVRVRPKDPRQAGFIGSVYLDRATAAIVRMSFTFTPASYVDPYLDYIRISLDNSLWMGKHWLPYRQELELRREIPELDFLAGSVIRGRFEIGPYEFNPELSPVTFMGPRVTALPPEQREAFPFERGLFDDLEVEGLDPAPSLEQIRAEARDIMAGRALSGLAPLRMHWPSFSDAIRYDRAEGLFLGGGVHVRPAPDVQARLAAGWAFGRERGTASVSVEGVGGGAVPVVRAYWDELRDLGPFPGAAPVVRSLGAAVVGRDWLDPYFARGVSLTLRGPRPEGGPEVTIRGERHRSAELVLDAGDFPPVRPVEEGTLGAVDVRAPFALPGSGEGRVSGTLGRLDERSFGSALLQGLWRLERPGPGWKVRLHASAGAASPEAPVQELFHLGGRGTLPGYDFRRYVGRAFWLARVEGTHPLLLPWVGIRAFAALGGTALPAESLPSGWPTAAGSGGPLASVGAGLSLGWDVLRLDLARGLGEGGRWELIFSVDPRFHPWL